MAYTGPPLVFVATGVVGSAWLSGAIASCTLTGTRAAHAVPATTAKVWHELYSRGANLMPKIAGTVAVVFGYCAYETQRQAGQWQGYAYAALSVLAIVPFTLTMMVKTNASLHAAAKPGATTSFSQVSELISKWDVLNLTRSTLPLVGTFLAFNTFLQNLS